MMIITATVRISSIRSSTNTIDITWFNFWQFVEGCVAVTMVSSTAFRSLFIAHVKQRTLKKRPHLNRNTFWNLKLKTRRNARTETEHDETLNLPEIPRATLTGMNTFIRGDDSNDKSQLLTNETLSEDENPLSMLNVMSTRGIGVNHNGSVDVKKVSFRPFSLLDRDAWMIFLSFKQVPSDDQKTEYQNFV